MSVAKVKPDYYVYFQLKATNCLTRIGYAGVVSGTHYKNCTAAGLNITSDVTRITMDDYWPDDERLLFRPLPEAMANKQYMAVNYVPYFYLFLKSNSAGNPLRRIGIANYFCSEICRNNQGFDIDWGEMGIRVKQERVSSESDLLLLPTTK